MNQDSTKKAELSTQATVAVVGPGAIGTTLAAVLHEAGRTPLLCGRTPRNSLELHEGDNRIHVPGPVRTDPNQQKEPVDLVFLTVKSTQVEAAVPWLKALCGPRTVVCVLQNGVEQKAEVAPHFPETSVIPAVVWFPAQAQSDGSVWLRGKPRLTVPDGEAGQRVQEVLQGTRCSIELASDFASLAWRKLLQNAVAGLMVLTGRRSGIFQRADIGQLAIAYMREGLAVARAEGADLADAVAQVILDAFRSNPPDMGTSILADRQADRPLEWNTRNGVILRFGNKHGISTPISEVIVPLLAAASDGPG